MFIFLYPLYIILCFIQGLHEYRVNSSARQLRLHNKTTFLISKMGLEPQYLAGDLKSCRGVQML